MSFFKSPTVWFGPTFPHKDKIAGLGGRWDADAKAWRVPALSMRVRSDMGWVSKTGIQIVKE